MATQSLKLAISGGNLTITSLPLLSGQVGQTYTFLLTAKGGVPPYTFAIDPSNPLPAGLTLSNGTISGTPTTVGNYTVGLSVTDSANNTALQPAPLAIATSGASLPDGSYSFEFSGTGPHGAIALNGGFLIQATSAVGLRREHRLRRISNQSEYWWDHSGARNQRLVATQAAARRGRLGDLCLGCTGFHRNVGNDTAVRMIEFDDTMGPRHPRFRRPEGLRWRHEHLAPS